MERAKKEAHSKILSGVEALKKKTAKSSELHDKVMAAQREREAKKVGRVQERQAKRVAGFQELQKKKTQRVEHEVGHEIQGKGVKKSAESLEKKVAGAASHLRMECSGQPVNMHQSIPSRNLQPPHHPHPCQSYHRFHLRNILSCRSLPS